jgi:hypothetical protein
MEGKPKIDFHKRSKFKEFYVNFNTYVLAISCNGVINPE